MKYFRIWACGAAMLAGGCGDLAYVHNGSLGVDLTASSQGTAKLAIGYENDTFAVVPRSGSGDKAEAMTLVSVSNVVIDGLNEVVFNHVVATGQAALNVANDPNGQQAMRAAVFGNDNTTGK
jgi:hypothetical protein